MSATRRPYHDSAALYKSLGWHGVLPLPPDKKKSPPTGYTGWHGIDPTSKQIELWRITTTGNYQASSNICIHMPDGVIGIDVDDYEE